MASVPKYKMKIGRIKYRGTFDFENLYKVAYKWLQDNGFIVFEDMYKYKPDDEIEMKFHGDRKITGYIMYRVSVRYFSQKYIPVEVVKAGKKKEMIQGRIFIDTTFEVITDYESLWKESPFKERMKILLERYILNERIDTLHVDNLYYITRNLNEHLKETLGMQTHKMGAHKRPDSYDEEDGYGE